VCRLCEKYRTSKEKTELLTKDLELYKQNEELLQDRLRGEQRAREELSAVLAKKDEKLKKNVKNLEEEQAKRERLVIRSHRDSDHIFFPPSL
jgi:dsDNA-binding SOS-regulon protein